jgi:hypothetical protein
MVDKSEVQELITAKNVLEEQVDELNKKLFSKKDTPADTHKDEEIELLKTALRESQGKSNSDVSETMLPCIDDTVYIKAKKIIYIKEIQPCVYMTTLLKWMMLYASKLASKADENSQLLILIYDRLENAYTMKKYTKNNISINTVPTNHAVVTNKLDKSFLINTLKIEQYGYIFVIDRLGFNRNAVNRSDMYDYYLINSPSDLTDFKLKPEKCVAFYNSEGKIPYENLPDKDLAVHSISKSNFEMTKIFKTAFISKCLMVK